VKDIFDKKGLAYQTADVTMIPKNTVRLEAKEAEQALRLVDLLEDNDDVQNVHANFDISKEVMDRLNA
jgi:transcriptional/translational regulatory protein YebC/TACO1